MIFTICNCKIVKLNKMHMLLIATTVIDILLSIKKYTSRSKQIIYLCNIHFIPMSYYCILQKLLQQERVNVPTDHFSLSVPYQNLYCATKNSSLKTTALFYILTLVYWC